ncbi:TetR/AcrR family transcriptional regulator [Kocuria soli]|uniref:TetR/AcrR family transcriptional regulator n=1 Tax=Kocuria soli TaxID=2485125 RepID=A0A3N3ZRA3_9MICC|nr:TetR family transcriptional regulator [Kocuria soli]ROZ61967.1 TetR/AcrR family transcriptional regulator [Kocuria soli]
MKGQRTQQRILTAARSAFAERGYDGVSVRSVATAAGVDQALVHRYFGTKQELFLAATEVPRQMGEVVQGAMQKPDEELGAALVEAALRTWDSEVSAALISTARTVLASAEAAPVVRDVVLGTILRDLPARIGARYGEGEKRVSLVATQMVGLLVARKLVGLEPLRSMPIEELTVMIGPTVQRYLTGDLEGIQPEE